LFTGLCTLRTWLWLSHSGQCLFGASTRYQDLQERSTSWHANRQDKCTYQENHHARAESVVWYEKGLRCVARGVAGTATRALQMPIFTVESSAIFFIICIVIFTVKFCRAATNCPDSRRVAIRSWFSRSCSCAFCTTFTWPRARPGKYTLQFIEDFSFRIMPTQQCRMNKWTNELLDKYSISLEDNVYNRRYIVLL